MTRAHMTCGAHVSGAGPSADQSAPRGRPAPPSPRPRTWERPRPGTGTGTAGEGGGTDGAPAAQRGSRRGVPGTAGYSCYRALLGTAGTAGYHRTPPGASGHCWVQPVPLGTARYCWTAWAQPGTPARVAALDSPVWNVCGSGLGPVVPSSYRAPPTFPMALGPP